MQLNNKTILVTGGAGFIGSHLVDALAGTKVRILDDFSTGSRENLKQAEHSADLASSIETFHGDVRDPIQVEEAMQGVDVVFHLACRGVRHSIGNPQENHEVNATGTLVVLQAALQHGVERFIHVSSSEVYGTATRVPMDEQHPCRPETVYGAAKLAGEAYARSFYRTYGLPVVVVRPFNNFGPRSHFEGDAGEVIPRFCVWALNEKKPLIFGDGLQTRDFIYVEDTACWLRRIAESEQTVGRTLNLGTGGETSVNMLAELIYEIATGQGITPCYLEDRPGDVHRLVANTALATELIGFHPATSLRDGIGRLLDHLRQCRSSPRRLLASIERRNWIEQDHLQLGLQ